MMTESAASDLTSVQEAHFEAAEWHCHSVSFVQHSLLGPHDNEFGRFFSAARQTNTEQRGIWMKIHTVSGVVDDEESEAGYRFLAFDPSDGSLWYQHITSTSDISKAVEEFNQGLEFEEDVLLEHIDNAVKGKRDGMTWRFATERVMEKGGLLPTKILGYISFRCLIGRIALDFKFDCQKVRWEVNFARQNLSLAHLIQPFYANTQYLIDLTTEMARIIERKDKEIEDYKNQGGKVSRKYLATTPFDMPTFTASHLQNFTPVSISDASKISTITEIDTQIKKRSLEIALEVLKNRFNEEKERKSSTESPSSSPKKSEKPTANKTKTNADDVIHDVTPAASQEGTQGTQRTQGTQGTQRTLGTQGTQRTQRTLGTQGTRSAAKVSQKTAETVPKKGAESVKPPAPKKKRGLF